EGDHILNTDGPFAETKEVLGGWVAVECKSREEALQIAQTFPGVDLGFAVEVRPLFVEGQTQPCWRTP
ncbi:MAG TPA: YciI family protein, partial [Opitutaceae bacterium]|nr:YciI family protein [Opitutaceae bacterium]